LIFIDGKSNVEANEVGVAPFTRTKKATKQAKTSTAKHRNLQKQRKLARDLHKAKKVEDPKRLNSFPAISVLARIFYAYFLLVKNTR
jgi:hypothetical protein